MKIEWFRSRGERIYIDGKEPGWSWSCGDDGTGRGIICRESDGSPLHIGGLLIIGISLDKANDDIYKEDGEWRDPPKVLTIRTTTGDITAKIVNLVSGDPDAEEEELPVTLVNGKQEAIDECTLYILADTEA